MELSLRLKTVASMVDQCECIADIGTDHAYIPIYLIKNNLCERVIASDINKGPVEKAKFNVDKENLQNTIQCRIGGGLSTIKPGESQGLVIAGMGGNLICDILQNDIDVFKSVQFAVLQPVQNPEVLRKYIYKSGYKIIDEELCLEDNRFYEIIKISYGNKLEKVDDIFYEVGRVLIDKKHPLLKKFIDLKLNKYNRILKSIKEDTELASKKKNEVSTKMEKLKEILECL